MTSIRSSRTCRAGRCSRSAAAGLGFLLAALAACAAPGTFSEPSDPPRRLRIGYPGPRGFGELPSFLATRQLEAEGYIVESTFYVQPELAVEALVQGNIDVSVGSSRIYWVAAARGAPVVAVIEGSRRNHVLVVAKTITSCRQLAGRRVGLTGLAAMGTTLYREFLKHDCGDIEPETLLIAGSPNRAAALVTGTIDAAVMFRAEAVQLARRVPDRFGALETFEARWSDLITSAMFVHSGFAKERAGEIQAYVRALLGAYRSLGSDEAAVAAEASRLMDPDEDYASVAEAYLAVNAWDPEGGLTAASVEKTLEFLLSIGELDAPLPEARLVDRTFLERARAEAAPTP